eukprot:scaffold909_cov121-Isochrysis_galbana.AAC.3
MRAVGGTAAQPHWRLPLASRPSHGATQPQVNHKSIPPHSQGGSHAPTLSAAPAATPPRLLGSRVTLQRNIGTSVHGGEAVRK